MTLSFTIPSEVSRHGSITHDDPGTPSPRQASFATSDCPMNYSDDINSDLSSSHGELENINYMSPISLASNRQSVSAENGTHEHESNEVPSNDTAGVNIAHSHCEKAIGESALSVSSPRFYALVSLIEKGADINVQDLYGRTSLHLVCENKEPDCLRYILGKGTADVNRQDMAGRTPLHVAARHGCVTCIRLLLAGDARTDIRDSEGDTPLHLLLSQGNRSARTDEAPPFEIQSNNESHSSVQSTSSLLLGHDDINRNFGGTFYQTPRGSFRRSHQGADAVLSTDTEQGGIHQQGVREMLNRQNDSGYFTCSGSAWVKHKYYNKDKIDEESTVSRGSEGRSSAESKSSFFRNNGVVAKDEIDSESDCSSRKTECANELTKGTWVFDCLEFMLRVVLCLLHSLLTWSTQHKKNAKPGDPTYRFVKPPDHVAEAMERRIQLNQLRNDAPT